MSRLELVRLDDEAVEVADVSTDKNNTRFVDTVLEPGRPLTNVGTSDVCITLDVIGIKEDI